MGSKSIVSLAMLLMVLLNLGCFDAASRFESEIKEIIREKPTNDTLSIKFGNSFGETTKTEAASKLETLKQNDPNRKIWELKAKYPATISYPAPKGTDLYVFFDKDGKAIDYHFVVSYPYYLINVLIVSVLTFFLVIVLLIFKSVVKLTKGSVRTKEFPSTSKP